jgi:hypothetical protein
MGSTSDSCVLVSRPCVICVLVGASQVREHSDPGPFGHGPKYYVGMDPNTHICIYKCVAFRRCFLVDGAPQLVDKGTLSSCLLVIHEHLFERVIETKRDGELLRGPAGATLTM